MPSITVHLSGYLAQLAGVKTFVTQAETAREALEALQFFDKLNPEKTSRRYVVKCSECDFVDQLDMPLTVKDLHLKPQPYAVNSLHGGSGDAGSFLRIVVGVVMIVVGVMYDWTGSLAQMGAGLVAGGIGMVLGGVYSLLFPVEEPESQETSSALSFSNINTTESGTPIAILLGRFKFGGQMLSFNIDSINRGAATTAPAVPTGWKKLL
jgi:predicted phage tail protein